MHYEIRLFGIITKKVTVVYTKFKFNVQVFDQRTPIAYALAGKGFCVGQLRGRHLVYNSTYSQHKMRKNLATHLSTVSPRQNQSSVL